GSCSLLHTPGRDLRGCRGRGPDVVDGGDKRRRGRRTRSGGALAGREGDVGRGGAAGARATHPVLSAVERDRPVRTGHTEVAAVAGIAATADGVDGQVHGSVSGELPCPEDPKLVRGQDVRRCVVEQHGGDHTDEGDETEGEE